LQAVAECDTDEWVHPLLIRLSAAFLDQGVAHWSMPDREQGFLSAVRRLYGRTPGPPLPWAHGLQKALAEQERLAWNATTTVEWALAEMGVAPGQRADVIRETLLSLRGWAGMMRHLEVRPDRAPVFAPAASLMDYLAIQLVFDVFAARWAARNELGQEGPLAETDWRRAENPAELDESLIYEAYILAQLSDVPLDRFTNADVAEAWMRAVCAFGSEERRRVLHLAYERRHRVEVLDALAAAEAAE